MNILNIFKRKSSRKVFVIGLDCADPKLVFEKWKDDLPNLRHLMESGIYGKLKSATPAITVPAWSSMLTSKDPGVLGFYGFRNRADYSYEKMTIAMGDKVREKRIWNYLSKAGLKSTVICVPQTYPVRPLNGHLISGFLTPNIKSDFTYPFSLKKEILSVEPDFVFDVKDFRTDDKDRLLDQIYTMTKKQFNVVDYMLKNKPWNFFMHVVMGVDRIHHAFWHFTDTEHFRYEAGNQYENAIRDYYIFIDQKIGEWLNQLDKHTSVLVVSDHGAKRMDGGICINEWLWRNGYLHFKNNPKKGQIRSFDEMEIDWSKTKAWGSGGYYGRLFLNVKDREPNGIIPPEEYENVRDELIEKLKAITNPEGENIGTRVFKPQDVYKSINNIPPDLIIYFGDLLWRSVGSMGYDGWHTYENDTGPDSCNHAEHGLFILSDPKNKKHNRMIEDAQLMDIAPTVLSIMGQKVPSDMQGKVIS